MKISYLYYDSPIGLLRIEEDRDGICALAFCGKDGNREKTETETPLLVKAASQLAEYFAGTRREFDLQLTYWGSDFQEAVLDALREIPYGETRTYGQIAEKVGHKKAYRAVGMANNRNPLPIFVPCHRVLSQDGKLTGYAGGMEIKKFLLELEGVKVEEEV